MPKIQEFNIKNYGEYEIKELLKNELVEKANKINFHGATMKFESRWNSNLSISKEDIEKFKTSSICLKLLKKKYEEDKQNKIEIYEELRTKLDYCLFDVKPYLKLCEAIDEFTYCGATNELDIFKNRYLKGKGYTRAKYRARREEFSKIKC